MDAKLKEAMSEIRGIMKKHDIGGYIILASDKHAEFGCILDPSFSAAYWEDKEHLKFRIKQSEIGKEKAEYIADSTVHMIASIQDLCAMGHINTTQLLDALSKHIEIERGTPKIIPHYEN